MSKKLQNIGLAAGAALAIGTAAMMSDGITQGVAEFIAGETPEMPVKVEAKRGPVHTAIAIDGSASKIRKQVGTAMSATADFISKGGLLQDGDTVRFCELGGETKDELAAEPAGSKFSMPAATCTDYTLPGDESALIGDINDTRSDHWSTHVFRGLETMNTVQEPCALAVWTDAITEERTDHIPVPHVDLGTCELKMLVPSPEYTANAQAICAGVTPADQCEVVQANSGDDVKKALSGVVGEVQAKAQAEADAKAEADYRKAMEEYDRARAELKAKAEQYKNTARTVVGIGFAAFLAGVAGLAAYVNRPIVRGYAYLLTAKGKFRTVDLEGDYGRGTVNLAQETPGLPNVTFKATWAGKTFVNGREVKGEALRAGEPVANGVFYSAEALGKRNPRRVEIEAELRSEK